MLKENELIKIQTKINYQFKNKKLLQQAFTRKSYSNAFGGIDNEVLEFFGDRILDYAVTMDLYDRYGNINKKNEFFSVKSVGDLCKIDVELVKNSNLADQITRMGLTKYIQVVSNREKSNLKNKADIFEAILGAVAIDSDWNKTDILNAYRSMMLSYGKATAVLEILKDDYIDTFETLIWRYQICKTDNIITKEADHYTCDFVIIIDGTACQIHGIGKTEKASISDAYETGSKLIALIIEKEFISDESYTGQLYFLYTNGFAPEPEFHFEYFPRNTKNNDELWRCYGSFAKSENEYITEESTLANAKEQASYAMLCEVLGLDFENSVIQEKETSQSYVSEKKISITQGQGLLKHILSMLQTAA